MTVASPAPKTPEGPSASIPPNKPKRWPGDWIGITGIALFLLGAGTCVFVDIKDTMRTEKFRTDPELATVEMILGANPDFEHLSSDKKAKTIEVRNKQTGKRTTATFEDIKNGKFSKEGSFGGTSKLPAWLTYPGSSPVSGFSVERSFNRESVTTVTTTDSPQQVLSFYEGRLSKYGFGSSQSISFQELGRTAGGSLDAESFENGHVSVAVAEQGQLTSITVLHKQPK